jgi:hypothetical protein
MFCHMCWRLPQIDTNIVFNPVPRRQSDVHLDENDSLACKAPYGPILPNNQNFDLNKSRQKFHHSLKEHHKISNSP